jgi:hypothetical protein
VMIAMDEAVIDKGSIVGRCLNWVKEMVVDL